MPRVVKGVEACAQPKLTGLQGRVACTCRHSKAPSAVVLKHRCRVLLHGQHALCCSTHSANCRRAVLAAAGADL